MALAHTIDSKVEATYRRGDLFKKRVEIIEDWAKYAARDAGVEQPDDGPNGNRPQGNGFSRNSQRPAA
jgi:hypothetical protein